MNRRKKRKELFSIYSDNFRVVTQALKLYVPHPTYVCPLCRRFFSEDALNQVRTTFILDGKAIGSTIKILPNKKLVVFMSPKRTDPKYHKDIYDFVSHKSRPGKFKFNIPAPDLSKVGISLLRSAYLLIFKELGYEYIFGFNVEKIRQWIQNYNSNPIPFSAISNMGGDDRILGINKIIKPNHLSGCYLVVIKIKNKAESSNLGIILPDINNGVNYKNLEINGFTIDFTPVKESDLTKLRFNLDLCPLDLSKKIISNPTYP